MGFGAFLIIDIWPDSLFSIDASYSIEKTHFPPQIIQPVPRQPLRDEELGSIQHAQLTADNILDKLLRPSQTDKKTSQHEKYRPKFEKRDNETLNK